MLTSNHNCLTCCVYRYFFCLLLTQRKAQQVCTQPADSPVNRLILAGLHPCDCFSPLPFSLLLLKASYTGAILLSPPALPNPSCSNRNNTATCRIPFHCVGKCSYFTPGGGKECQIPGKDEHKSPKRVRSTSFWLLEIN